MLDGCTFLSDVGDCTATREGDVATAAAGLPCASPRRTASAAIGPPAAGSRVMGGAAGGSTRLPLLPPPTAGAAGPPAPGRSRAVDAEAARTGVSARLDIGRAPGDEIAAAPYALSVAASLRAIGLAVADSWRKPPDRGSPPPPPRTPPGLPPAGSAAADIADCSGTILCADADPRSPELT
jgi:hypothetical protein